MSQKVQFDTCHNFANKSGHNLFEEVKFGIWHLIGHIRQRKSRNCNLRRAIIKSAVSCANNSGRLLFTGNTNSRQAGKCQISWVLTEFPLALKVKLLKGVEQTCLSTLFTFKSWDNRGRTEMGGGWGCTELNVRWIKMKEDSCPWKRYVCLSTLRNLDRKSSQWV